MADQRPNILFIMADDLGYMDTAAYGSEYYETPNIDRLAEQGMLFTDAYSASPLCSPTRASIMTGKYPARLRITTPACHLPPHENFVEIDAESAPWQKVVTPNVFRYLRHSEYTIAEAFRDAGYATSFFGKWHLGHRDWWADTHGFDYVIGGTEHPGPPSFYSPYRIPTIPDGPEGENLSTRIHNEAIDYLKQDREPSTCSGPGGKPFFMCLWEYAVHAPFGSECELHTKYAAKTDPRGFQDSPTMGGMIERMDMGIGRVLDTLAERGLDKNTIVIFFSDNGGNMYNLVDEGVYPTNNAPLRSGKGNNYEGGVRVPCIVRWPDVVEPGSRCAAPVSSVDWYSTLLEMAGIEHNPDQIDDGESFVPLLNGQQTDRDRPIFSDFAHYTRATENLPNSWVRLGDYKLLRFFGEGPNRTDKYELYNLRDDIGETNDLAPSMPEKVNELDALLAQHFIDVNAVMPILNPKYEEGLSMPPPDPNFADDAQAPSVIEQGGPKKR